MNNGSYAVAVDGESRMIFTDRSQSTTLSASGLPPQHDFGGGSVADRLRAARQALNLSQADVALRTRVTLRHIEALEAGDYAAMPGRPYAIGFARAYARTVDLDDSDIADAVRAELNGRAPRPEIRILNQFEVGDPAKTPSRFVGWLALLLVGAILALGGVFWRSYYAPSVPLPSLAGEAPQAPANLPRNEVQRLPSATQSAINSPVIFTALDNDIWVKFYDGQGKQLMQKQLAKGESYTIPGDAAGPRIWTGRPDALSITIGGQAIPRLAEVEKVMKDVPVDAASLRARSALTAKNPSSPSAGSSSPAL